MNMKQRSFAPSSHENEKAKSAWNNEKNGDVKPGDIIIMKGYTALNGVPIYNLFS